MKIHHIGYLAQNIEKAKKVFQNLEYSCISDVTHDEYRKVDICFMEKDGYIVELVSPYSEDSVTAGLMKTKKNSMYHVCYEVDELESAIADLKKKGFIKMDEPNPAPAIGGRNVCFLINSMAMIIELLEK